MGIHVFQTNCQVENIFLSVAIALLVDVFPLPVVNNIRTAFWSIVKYYSHFATWKTHHRWGGHRLFPCRKQAMPFLTIGNQVFQNRRCHICFNSRLDKVETGYNLLMEWNALTKCLNVHFYTGLLAVNYILRKFGGSTWYGKGKDKVCIRAKWPIRPELVPVSVASSDWEFFYSPLDGMLVHRRVTPSIKFAGTHLYTWVERGTVRVKCLAQEHDTMSLVTARTQTCSQSEGEWRAWGHHTHQRTISWKTICTLAGNDFSTSFLTRLKRKGSSSLWRVENPLSFSSCVECILSNSSQE